MDLNADLGEECGDDRALLDVITSANIATGAHAGGGDILTQTVFWATERGVAVGAHPSYRDRAGFGRTSHLDSLPALLPDLIEQVLGVAEVAASVGVELQHVKAHGALYNDASANPVAAHLFLDMMETLTRELHSRGMLSRNRNLPVMGQPNSAMSAAAQERGALFLSEGFADRAYLPDGRLVPRSQPGAVLEDPEAVVAQALQMATQGTVTTPTGVTIPMPVDTICVHGDTPAAAALAVRIRNAFLAEGLELRTP